MIEKPWKKWTERKDLNAKLLKLLKDKNATPGVKRQAKRQTELNKQFDDLIISLFDHSISEAKRLLAGHKKNLKEKQ